MPRKAASQWNFGNTGELFPTEATRRVFSVSEITADVRRTLEKQFGQIWVTGEITNFRLQSSGHIYFTLKDANSQLSCVLFRNDPVAQRESLKDGAKVILQGEMTVYEARGQYQLHVHAIELQGVGALQIAFEKLKQKLQAEGLFATERKRPLPRFPQRIGLVTSPTGAAIRDVLHVVQRRNPTLELILVPCLVQGPGAAAEIATGIHRLNEWSEQSPEKLDLILVTRGGGSLEDLWAFNEEAVARAIFESTLPVVSAVGHEIDFTISDFVADFRAATPSAAAEILTEDTYTAWRQIAGISEQLHDLAVRRVTEERRHFRQLGQRLLAAHPRRKFNEQQQLLDDLQQTLHRCAHRRAKDLRLVVQNLTVQLGRVRPARLVAERRDHLKETQRQLREHFRRQWQDLRHRSSTAEARLRLLGPEQTLARGYSITTDDATGQIIRAAEKTQPGQKIRTRVQAGEIRSVVEE